MVTYKGVSADNITEQNISHIRSRGYFGTAEIGYYAVYLGPTDGGYACMPPDNPELKGVPKEEIEEWKNRK